MLKNYTENTYISYNRFHEKKIDVNDLCFITKFMKFQHNKVAQINKIILNFSFKTIAFNKKRIALFLFILELLANRPNTTVKAKKHIIYLNIKKNSFVGCKITLRQKDCYDFIDTLILYLPRIEKTNLIKNHDVEKNKFNNFSFWLTQLFKFYSLQNLQNDFVQNLHITFVFNSWFKEEKVFLLTSNNLYVQN